MDLVRNQNVMLELKKIETTLLEKMAGNIQHKVDNILMSNITSSIKANQWE